MALQGTILRVTGQGPHFGYVCTSLWGVFSAAYLSEVVGGGRSIFKARGPSAPTGRVCMEENAQSPGNRVLVTCMCLCVCVCVYVFVCDRERERLLATEACL